MGRSLNSFGVGLSVLGEGCFTFPTQGRIFFSVEVAPFLHKGGFFRIEECFLGKGALGVGFFGFLWGICLLSGVWVALGLFAGMRELLV